MAPIISSVTGGLMVLLTTYINNKLQLQREQKLWEREQKRRERERTYELYEKCVSRLTRLGIAQFDKQGFSTAKFFEGDLSEPLKSYVELNAYMCMFLENYPNQFSEEFKDLKQDTDDFFSHTVDPYYPINIRKKLVRLVEGERKINK